MEQKSIVSMAVVRRLPRYLRHLDELHKIGADKISSTALAARMELTASQVRQDLNCFGCFGQQGYGYNVEFLRQSLADILGLSGPRSAIIIGMGNLGHTLCNNFSFSRCGFSLGAAFDANPAVIGSVVAKIRVLDIKDLDKYCSAHKPDIAVLTLPAAPAPAIAHRLVQNGIKGIWNFTNTDLNETRALVENINFADSLMTLCYRIKTSNL